MPDQDNNDSMQDVPIEDEDAEEEQRKRGCSAIFGDFLTDTGDVFIGEAIFQGVAAVGRGCLWLIIQLPIRIIRGILGGD